MSIEYDLILIEWVEEVLIAFDGKARLTIKGEQDLIEKPIAEYWIKQNKAKIAENKIVRF